MKDKYAMIKQVGELYKTTVYTNDNESPKEKNNNPLLQVGTKTKRAHIKTHN